MEARYIGDARTKPRLANCTSNLSIRLSTCCRTRLPRDCPGGSTAFRKFAAHPSVLPYGQAHLRTASVEAFSELALRFKGGTEPGNLLSGAIVRLEQQVFLPGTRGERKTCSFWKDERSIRSGLLEVSGHWEACAPAGSPV